ncbi:hypothetical protein [Bacillus sp. V33-4]|uniref:hypothetical protein n=1 Tax=Bacillus sp. V33-4 TaxID=2054169 RepID=UPI0015E07BEE|nr:hypothetical protein [Bacillus sp. V33-4]
MENRNPNQPTTNNQNTDTMADIRQGFIETIGESATEANITLDSDRIIRERSVLDNDQL